MQIISLGAGTDSRYWRLREKNLHLNVLYHEIDFPSVSAGKLTAIRRSVALSPAGASFNVLNRTEPELEPDKVMWGFFRDPPYNSQGYLFHPIDLRRPFEVEKMLTNVPTLLVSECCLCYLSTEQAQGAIQYFTSLIPTLGIAIYEPTNPHSTFGRTMSRNLSARGLYMPTVYSYPTLDKQMERLRDAGFSDAQNGADVLWLWKNWIPDAEKERISSLEMLDELEEWELLASHYAIVWGWRELVPARGAFSEWLDDCPGQLPYPEGLQDWGEEEEEGQEDMADIKIESIEADE
jgi:[phosphatase 2A protein]-leucine-carboxy methyltransferase